METATKNCSVSLGKNGRLIDHLSEYSENNSHAERLHILIETLFTKTGFSLKDIDAIAVSKGPGSYTGLRIGVSSAKGLCFALKIPLIAIDTLTIMVNGRQSQKADYFIPMIDAKRKEVYTATLDQNLHFNKTIHALSIDQDSFKEYKGKKVVFMGSGLDKYEKFMLTNKNFIFLKGIYPCASNMVSLAYEKYQIQDFESVAYFEPFYLKDFIITSSKKRFF